MIGKGRGLRSCIALLVAGAIIMPALPAHAVNVEAHAPITSVRSIPKTQNTDAYGAPNRITEDTLNTVSAATAQDNGVVGDYAPVQAQAMRNERYDGWPLIGGWLSDLSARDTSTPFAAQIDDDVTEGDGTTIKNLSVQWLATHDATNVVSPKTNLPVDFIARVNMALSGQKSYEPGSLQFTMPLNIFKDRFGKDEGALAMSLPEDPDKSSIFNYKRLDDRVMVTNTQKLPAGYQGYFDLKFEQIVPSEVISGRKSDPLTVQLTVLTDKGNTLRKTSNSIDAVINTQEQVTAAQKTGTLNENMPAAWNTAGLDLPKDFQPQDYYYVDWYTYARVSGNQYFTLDVTDEPNLDEPYANGIIIGSTIPNAQISEDRRTLHAAAVFNGYVVDGANFYYHTYMAYPRSEFKVPDHANDGTSASIDVKSMKNTVTYTLTTDDTKQKTTASKDSTVTYREYIFRVPDGMYNIFKWGIGQDGSKISLNPSQSEWNGASYVPISENIGLYPHALNDLENGKSVNLTYNVVSTNYPYKNTYDGVGDADNPDSYGKKSVHIELLDDAMAMPDLDPSSLDDKDYSVKSLRILDPAMYSYMGSSKTGWDYMRDNMVARPEMRIYGKKSNGDWVKFATASWGSDGLGQLALAAENGAVATGSVLNLPESVIQWKLDFDTAAAAIYSGVLPTVQLKSNDRTKALVSRLMSESQTPQTDVTNTITQTVSQQVNGKEVELFNEDRTGVDRLAAASQSVWMEKNGKQTGVDKSRRLVSLHYKATVYEASNQTSEEGYRQLMDDGILPSDPSGTYYDLLPRNLRVNLTSVQAEGLQSVRQEPNWRGSGRTMLIVSVKNTPAPQQMRNNGVNVYGTTLSITYDATLSWFDLKESGVQQSDGNLETMLTNNIAYASDAPRLGTVEGRKGEPDNPAAGNNIDSKDATKGVEQYMTDLNGANDDPSVVYAKATTNISALTYAFIGLYKSVSSDTDGVWVSQDASSDVADRVSVAQGGTYRYRITYETAQDEQLKNLVFYDDLEEYTPTKDKPDYGKPKWQGTLLGVDTSDLEAHGIDPVVYYALESPKLQGSDTKPDLTSPAWTTTPPEEMSQVKAVAVDCSKLKEGGSFTLAGGKSLQLQLRMRAPGGASSAEYIEQGAHAYNNAYMSARKDDMTQRNEFIHQEYTKISLTPFTVPLNKVWDDDDDRDGMRTKSVTVQLTRNGQPYGDPIVLDDGNEWKHVFKNLEQTDAQGNPYTWSASETEVPAGYHATIQSSTSNSGVAIAMTNTHEVETVRASGTKSWEGDSGSSTRPTSITVNLYRDGGQIQSKQVTVDAAGTWSFDFGDLVKNRKTADGRTEAYTYTVREAYVEGYVPVYSGNGGSGYGPETAGSSLSDGLDIVNRYDPYGDISLTKTASSVTDASKDSTFTFNLTLRTANGEPDSGTYPWTRVNADGTPAVLDGVSEGTIGTGGTVQLKAGQTVRIHRIPSTDTYAWSELGLGGFTISSSSNLTGTVTSGGNTQTTVNNVYRTRGGVQLKARKVLNGRALSNMQFSFVVHRLDDNGNPIVGANGKPAPYRTASNDANGDVNFGRISYTNEDVGKTYRYRISEIDLGKPGYTYDPTSYTVTVHVMDNADGTISAIPHYQDAEGKDLADSQTPTFTNIYKASGDMELTANKVFVGGDLGKRRFTFEIVRDGKQVATATTNNDGEAVFKPIVFSEKDAGKTYEYIVREVRDGSDADDIVWDTHTETVRAQIVDNGDGTLQVNQEFSGSQGQVPLVWRNSAARGGLKLIKHITSDSNTQAKRDTQFPMEVTLAVPNGAPSFDGTHDVTVGTPVFDANGAVTSITQTQAQVTVKGGKFRVAVPAEGWVKVDGIPGGTSYLVTEVDSVTMPQEGGAR